MRTIALLALSLASLPARAVFDPALNSADQAYLHFLLTDLPGEILSHDPARIGAVEKQVATYALNERARERSDLELAVDTSFWAANATEPKWMIQSALSMIEGLDRSGHGTPETAAFRAALVKKQALLAQTEASLNTADPANLPRLLAALNSVQLGEGGKLSEIYLRLRAIYVPLQLPPAFNAIGLYAQTVPGLDLARWDETMNAVEREIADDDGARALPASLRASFGKSVADLFFTYKFPLLDLGYSAILDPRHPNPSLDPSAGAAEALSSLHSLERVLLLTDVFQKIDAAGGGRAYVRSFQPQVAPIDGLCARLPALGGFTADDWRKIHAYDKVIMLDPGHLGGDYADDGRNVSPPNEKGQESYGYREGHDTFVVANLVRKFLTQCAGLPEANVLLTRRSLYDEGGVVYNKSGLPLQGQPGPGNLASDNLYFRKVVITLAEPAFAISMHTDWSDTLTQHGLIVVPHPPESLEQGYYKSGNEYAISLGLADTLTKSLGETMFTAAGTPSEKSAEAFVGDEFREYYLTGMDLQIFRDFRATPAVLVEGYDYASPVVRTLMNAVARGHRVGDKDVKAFTVDGAQFYFHTVHQSYAEGVAIGALRFILGR